MTGVDPAVLVGVLVGVLVAVAAGVATGPRVRAERLLPPAAADPGVSDTALVVDLVAAALRAGLPLTEAVRIVAAACRPGPADGRPPAGTAAGLERLADALDTGERLEAVTVDPSLDPLVGALAFAVRSGAPVAPLLAEAARSVRRRRREAAVRAAGRLSASLVLPLGLAALPGFLLLGVAPVVVRLLTAMG